METTLEILRKRKKGSTMCPSEAARAVEPQNWRPLMPAVREAARDLAQQGAIEVTQKGNAVNIDEARGPIRLRLLEEER